MRHWLHTLLDYADRWFSPRAVTAPAETGSPTTLTWQERLGFDAQVSRIASVGQRRAELNRSVLAAQALATEKIQAADYALDRMLDELRSVMDVRPRTPQLTVVVPVRPVEIRRRRLAA
jgi:hypothetical protein